MSEREHIPKPPLFVFSKVIAFLTSTTLYAGVGLLVYFVGCQRLTVIETRGPVRVDFVEPVPLTLEDERKSGSVPTLPVEKVEETLPRRPVPEKPRTSVKTEASERIPDASAEERERLLAMMKTGSRGTGVIGDRSKGGREDAIAKYGGSLAAENAVRAALRWLSAHQDRDGRWSAKGFTKHCPKGDSCGGAAPRRHSGFSRSYDVGISGLALLCFLGHGNTHLEGDFRDEVKRGLDFLLRHQHRTSGAFGEGDRASMYNHAIATLALAEVTAMSKDPRLRKPLVRATNFICQAQQKEGGWDYTPAKTNRNDTSVTGWQVMALKSAKAAGVKIPWRTTYGILKHFERVTDEDGYVGYTNARVSRSNIALAAVGLLSNRYLGLDATDLAVRRQERIMLENLPAWHKLKGPRGRDHSMYYWYYATLAMYQQGGRAWSRWNAAIRDMVVRAQCRTGHRRGSWDPDGFWARQYAGRVYSTALMTLTLEIYYRYLPMYESTETLGSGSALAESIRTETNPASRIAMLNKLVMFKDPKLPQILTELLEDKNATVRFAAAKYLAQRGDRNAIPFLVKGLEHEDAFYRFSAIRALEELDHPDTIPALIGALSDRIHGNANVAARALQRKTGVRFGLDTTKDATARRKIIASWRTWWENSRSRFRDLPEMYGEVVTVRAAGLRVLIRVTKGGPAAKDMRLKVFRAGNLVGRVRVVRAPARGMIEAAVTLWTLEGAPIRPGDVVATKEPREETAVD